MNSIYARILCLVCMSWIVSPASAQKNFKDRTEPLIAASIKSGVDLEAVNQLFRDAVLADGSVEPILKWLADSHQDLEKPRDQIIAEIEVHLASRRGDLRVASETLDRLLENKAIAAKRTDLQIWQAKLHDALGDLGKAKEIYQTLTKKKLSDEDQQAVRLRLALMGLIGDASNKGKSDAKPLIELATKSKDVAFRNRAANVLAVQNQHAEAIKLFTITGEGTQRFRSASRVTEWAIRAKDRDKAIKFAWDAVGSSELKRDRNYALALLVESYRLKENKKGLEALVKKFDERNDSKEPMTAEMRAVWVNLLRELGRHEDAIKLFKSTADQASGFTVEMRRELLEMEGEAGNEDRMIESYRELIQSEPDELTWRSGLTQVLLERGQDDDAKALWSEYVAQLDRGSILLRAAQILGEFGLDDLADQTIQRMVSLRVDHGQALLYWADLQQRRGNVEVSEAVLNRIQEMDDIGDDVRSELASAYERLGRQDKAIEVNEAIRDSRDSVAEDLEMRLAWLYSEIGDEDKALDQWLALWKKITSIPRRRYVEDRLMTVASRLGTLADIAIELEEKLADGTADDREAGLLVRIYSRVNDSVAATEISEEYMSKTGKNEVEQLQEKGRIYQICNDYWNYEKVIERLIEVDPEGKTEYLRQLALSMLERGKAQEARAVLMSLRKADDGKDTIGGEFEAGVLSLVGMNAEAADAYRKGIAKYPDRIESYLLLANLLKDMRQTDLAVGMFQFLAENAERDDLFTIAIDGLLNMEAKGNTMQWARRITLERLAGREDKNYLYQLLSDLSSEVNDKSGQIRALENSLAVSGTRRLSVLRECMELSSKIRGGVYYSSSSRGPTNKGNQPFFAFGRRLIGLGELMPPQVFLNLGQAFLDDGDTESAKRTFAMARSVADPRGYQREVASIFEKAGKQSESLVRYERLLRTSPSDVALMARVAKLNEQQGKDDVAFRFYQRGLELLISQTPLTTQEAKKTTNRYWSSNRDTYQTYSERLLTGMLVTVPDDQIKSMFESQLTALGKSFIELNAAAKTGRTAEKLADSPRIEKRTSTMRRLFFSFEKIADLESMDQLLIKQFPKDKNLVVSFARERISHGRFDSVRRLVGLVKPDDDRHQQLLTMLGDKTTESENSTLSPKEMWQRFLPVWMNGDTEQARKILRRVDRAQGRVPGGRPSYTVINGVAVMQNSGASSDIGSWMRLALSLDDEGLALQFARSRLKSISRYNAGGIKQILDIYRGILPEEPFADLVRYAASIYKDDSSQLANYLWLIANMREHLGDNIPDDDTLMEMVEDSDLQIGYYFSVQSALEAFPESIRAEAIAETISRIDKKSRPRELIRVPFMLNEPVDEATATAILEAIKAGIEPAMQDNFLRYCNYSLPRSGIACRCPENADFAIAALDLFLADNVRKREESLPKMAEYIKAVVLHQSGRTEEALKIVLPSYDPTDNPTDYYVRYSRDWAYRELVPDATERFVAVLDKKIKDGKPTTVQTDQRIKLYLQTGDQELIRSAYKRAIKEHAKESKFSTAYEKWEERNNRVGVAIELAEKRLAELDTEKDAAKIVPVNKRLATLWFSTNHPVNGLTYWKISDDKDLKAFAEEESKRKKTESEKADPQDPVKQKPATKKAKTDKAKAAKKEFPSTIAGVKNAIDEENTEAAAHALRKIWRSFPPVVASPYGYRTTTKRLNGITWPARPKELEKATEKVDSKTSLTKEEIAQAEEQRKRNRLRGGLANFVPEKPKPRPKPESAWKVLAQYPFAVSEMKRILRSQPSAGKSNASSVVLGLLEAERLERGDDAVFASLITRIESGHISEEVLAQLFSMLDEDDSRINEKNIAIVDTLLDRLDLTNAKRASQLAQLCAKVGQLERSAALYRHCAVLSSFAMLISQAREHFEGESLLELAESMFVLTKQDAIAVTKMLELRLEYLDAKTAANRSLEIFDGELSANDSTELIRAIRGAEVFSRSGDYELATKCLSLAIERHGKQRVMPPNYYGYISNSRSLLSLSRSELIRVFPTASKSKSDLLHLDYSKWLRQACDAVKGLATDRDADAEIVTEALLVIALRQCELEQFSDAENTLENVTDELIKDATKHESLAIDVMRLAGQTERALELQSRLHKDGRLSHVRFGDYLRDTVVVHGRSKAAKLFDELVKLSLDQDLLRAGEESAVGDAGFVERVQQLQKDAMSARNEYESRSTAAAERAETRKKWKSKPAKASGSVPKP